MRFGRVLVLALCLLVSGLAVSCNKHKEHRMMKREGPPGDEDDGPYKPAIVGKEEIPREPDSPPGASVIRGLNTNDIVAPATLRSSASR